MKKQIVFVEYVPNIINLRIARSLKVKGDYETVLISFSEVDRELYDKAFDKILILNIKHKMNLKNLVLIFKKLKSREGKEFINEVKSLNPYLFQITGPDFFTAWIMFITKKSPKIYFAYDIWAFYGKKFSFKNLEIKEFVQRIIEKICIKKSDGILHKGPNYEIGLLEYKISVPNLAILPGCLDEWCLVNKNKKKGKELHLAYSGAPYINYPYRLSFLEIVKRITSQNIHFHTYGEVINKRENEFFVNEEKKNKYFHFHKAVTPEKLKRGIQKCDYGVVFEFCDNSKINPLWAKTTMANKIFDYIEAGIPIITNNQLEHISKIVEENDIGFVINYDELGKIKDLTKKQDYSKFIKNIGKARKKFSWNGNFLNELENFYTKISSKK